MGMLVGKADAVHARSALPTRERTPVTVNFWPVAGESVGRRSR